MFTKDNVGDSINPILMDIYQCLKNQSSLETYSLRTLNVILNLLQDKVLYSIEPLSEILLKLLTYVNFGFEF